MLPPKTRVSLTSRRPSGLRVLPLLAFHKDYPNHISHTLNSDADAAPPRKLTPAFYGCYDWDFFSSVHGHRLLVRLVRTFPDTHFVQAARQALRQSLTAENMRYSTLKPILLREVDYGAHHPVGKKMNASKAYDLASKTIYERLPICNHGEAMCGRV